MSILVRTENPKKDIWTFFTTWLGLLKGPMPAQAFAQIDMPAKNGEVWTVTRFRRLLAEFTGNTGPSYTMDDIDMSDSGLDSDGYADSSVHSNKDGSLYALLYVPLADKGSQILVLGFFFYPRGDGLYQVSLDGEARMLVT